jgi:hypothetical protein
MAMQINKTNKILTKLGLQVFAKLFHSYDLWVYSFVCAMESPIEIVSKIV